MQRMDLRFRGAATTRTEQVTVCLALGSLRRFQFLKLGGEMKEISSLSQPRSAI